jgi:hypothetical protein
MRGTGSGRSGLTGQCDRHRELLAPVVARYGEAATDNEPAGLHPEGLSRTRSGPVGLLRDLQDLHLLASLVGVTWAMIKQAGSALHDQELLEVAAKCDAETAVQLRWLQTRMKQAAPQALLAAR